MLSQVVPQVQQLFHRLGNNVNSNACVVHSEPRCKQIKAKDVADERFRYFVSNVFPQLHARGEGWTEPCRRPSDPADPADPGSAHTLIFVPSYFDYVRLRNYLSSRSTVKFCNACEYTRPS